MSPHHPLIGRAAIVTGAGRGTGAAIARALASAGTCVAVSDLNPDRAERVAADIVDSGGTAFAFQADVANKFQVAALIENTRDRFGSLHIFAHCAHVSPRTPALMMDEWDVRRTVEVNLIGAFFCAQLAGRVMADEGGGLIALAIRPSNPAESGSLFSATSHAVQVLAAQLAAEWADYGVRVAAFSLAPIEQIAAQLLALLHSKTN